MLSNQYKKSLLPHNQPPEGQTKHHEEKKNGTNHIEPANEEATYKCTENNLSPKTNPAIS
jgi:hypothetical protein